MRIHYEHTLPILYGTKVIRDIELSHWGNNMAVEEHYAVQNFGVK